MLFKQKQKLAGKPRITFVANINGRISHYIIFNKNGDYYFNNKKHNILCKVKFNPQSMTSLINFYLDGDLNREIEIETIFNLYIGKL